MKQIQWSAAKNKLLKKSRGICFEEIISAPLIDVLEHPKKTYQKIMLFEYQNYIWVVPFVEDRNFIFLKTIFPSRKYTKLYYKR